MQLAPTPFTELVGCRVPIQQAPMGGVTTVALAAAVAAEGGLGMLPAAGRRPDELLADLEAADAVTGRSCIGVNFLVPFLLEGSLDVAARNCRVVEFFYGNPSAGVVARARAAGARAAWQVGSVAEAVAAADAGCDFIVVQGMEAGGHVRGTAPLLPLLESIRAAVDVPIVAAGGIGSGEAVARAMLAGADAVRIGTRLLAADEANVHPEYLAALTRAGAADTVLTETFSLGWPDAPHRVLRSCVEASGDGPQSRSPMPPGRDFSGDVSAAALYAGTSVDEVTGAAPAGAIIRELLDEAAQTLSASGR